MPDSRYDATNLPPVVSKRLKELSALAEMNREIHSTMRVDRLLQILVEKTVLAVNFERCLIYLLEGEFLRCVAFLDRIKTEKASIIGKRVGFHMEEVAVETLAAKLGKSVYVQNVGTDHRMSPKLLKVSDTHDYCVVPLIGREGVLGVITGDKKYSNEPIEQEDIATLELFVGHISLAIDNARLYEQKENFSRALEEKVADRTSELGRTNKRLADEMTKLSTLYNMSGLLNSSLDLDQIMGKMLDMLEGLGHSACSVHLSDEGEAFSALSPALGQGSKALRGMPFTDEFFGMLGAEAGPILVRDIDGPSLKSAVRAFCKKEGIAEVWVIPVRREERALGAITLFADTKEIVPDDQEEFFLAFCQQASIALENALAYRRALEQKKSALEATKKLERENMYLRDKIKGDFDGKFVIGRTEGMRKAMDLISKVAPTSATVMIYGETGTGKELAAKSIQSLSPRRDYPLISLNCAAIPDNLLESELFGHEKGAFTGAHERKVGMFELANRGTIFLDEIGEVSLQTQAKLLRVLQEHEIQPLGAKAPTKIDVRVLAATNRDLKARVEEGEFRPDLFYRLNVFPIYLPPLRDRAVDIEDLVRYFVEKYSRMQRNKVVIEPSALELLKGYGWPGNIRELENVIERLTIISDNGIIAKKDLPREISGRERVQERVRPLREAVDDLKKTMVVRALAEAGGRKSRAAELLCLQRSNFSRLLKEMGLR